MGLYIAWLFVWGSFFQFLAAYAKISWTFCDVLEAYYKSFRLTTHITTKLFALTEIFEAAPFRHPFRFKTAPLVRLVSATTYP